MPRWNLCWRARWTVRLITEEAVKRKILPGVGRETIRLLLEHHNLKPWREKMWCVPLLDEACIAAMEGALATYERPYDTRNPVVCLDEKLLVLHGEKRSGSAARPGRSARRTHIDGATPASGVARNR